MDYTVWVGEPDVTHQTSWPESTGEYIKDNRARLATETYVDDPEGCLSIDRQ